MCFYDFKSIRFQKQMTSDKRINKYACKMRFARIETGTDKYSQNQLNV